MAGDFQVQGYDVASLISAGTTGEVWLGRAQESGDNVALKRIRLPDPAKADEIDRLVRLLGLIDHPHLQKVLDTVRNGDELILVLEYADGGNLDQLLSGRGGLDPGEVVTATGPIAEALAAAHERGLVHGDINPESIMFMTDGRPLIGDMGIFPIIAGPDTMVMHTHRDPAANEPSPAADVYGLASVAYTALTGNNPEPGQQRQALADAVQGLPSGLVHAIEAGLQTVPDRRPTADQLADLVFGACSPEAVRFPVGLVLSDADIAAALAKAGTQQPDQSQPGQPAQPDQGQVPPGQVPPGQMAPGQVPPGQMPGQMPPGQPPPPPPPAVDPFAVAASGVHQPNAFGPVVQEYEDEYYDYRPRYGMWIGIIAGVILLVGLAVGLTWWFTSGQGKPIAGPTNQPNNTSSAAPTQGPDNTQQPPPVQQTPQVPTGLTGGKRVWAQRLMEIDSRRATAYAETKPELLEQVYAPNSGNLLPDDQANIEKLRKQNARYLDMRYQISKLEIVSTADNRAVLEVTDKLLPFKAVYGNGQQQTVSLDNEKTHQITLVKQGKLWLIEADRQV